MPCRNKNGENLIVFGNLFPVKGCKGPQVSNFSGMDSHCCCRCDNIRNCYYRESITMTEDKNVFLYLEKLKNIGEDLDTSYVISNCNDKKIFAFQKKISELSYGSYFNILFEQFVIMNEMGIVIKDISIENFACTKSDIPIFYPVNGEESTYQINENYSEKGYKIIEINGKSYFSITSEQEYLNGNRYSFLYNFYKSLKFLTGKNYDKFSFCIKISNKNYFEIPEIVYNKPRSMIVTRNEKEKIIKIGDKKDKYVILDLDSTLIYSKAFNISSEITENKREFYIKLIRRKCYYKVIVRNYFDNFINSLLSRQYKIIIWSAGTEKYVKDIVSVLFKNYPIEYVFTYNHTAGDYFYKNLSIISNYIANFDIKNCRLLDDNEDHARDQEKYFIQAKPYRPLNLENDEDDYLKDLIEDIDKSFMA